jgi:hypothetical protein
MSDEHDFFAALCPNVIPPRPPDPEPEIEWSEEERIDMESSFQPTPLEPLDLDDIDNQRRALLAKFPNAHPGYLERVLASSKQHVWAMLKEKVDERIDALIARFLHQEGRTTSHENARVKGHGVDWVGMGNAGLLYRKHPSKAHGGYIYTLDLDNFDSARGARDALSGKDRKLLFEKHHNRCNLCDSCVSLQADHRIGVAQAGTSDGTIDAFQPLCRPCNLKKNVACGTCIHGPQACASCYWAFPERHTHTAGEPGSRAMFRLAPGTLLQARDLLRQHGLLAGVASET